MSSARLIDTRGAAFGSPRDLAPLLLLSAVVAACGSQTEAADAGASPSRACQLTHRPQLGAISDHGVKVWVRATASPSFRVRYWLDGKSREPEETPVLPIEVEHDGIGVAELSGLEPDTRYGYRVVLNGPDCVDDVDDATFRTLPAAGSASHVRFAVGADVYADDVPGFAEIDAQAPAFLIMAGDQVYQDTSAPTLEGYRVLYRRAWHVPQLAALYTHVPVFMIWDDHEIANNAWPGLYPDREAIGRQTYEEYQQSHNPAPLVAGGYYYTFRAGPADFFVADLRSYRSPETDADGPDKTLLGAEQKRALERWLVAKPEGTRVKILVSSVPFSDFSTTGDDSWLGYRYERDELMEYLSTHDVGAFFVITGDQHWSSVFRTQYGSKTPYLLYELMPTPLGIGNLPASTATSDQILARDDDQRVFAIFDVTVGGSAAAERTFVDYTLCQVGKACAPQLEPRPGPSEDQPGFDDNLPYTLHLETGPRGLVELE